MTLFADVVVLLVALLHGYFLILEMFLWDKPLGLKTFGLSKEQAATTKVLASNQGLYNGFIAAGLAYGVVLGAGGNHLKVYLLLCVVAAGVYGAMTANRKILFVQGIPGAAALLLVLLSGH